MDKNLLKISNVSGPISLEMIRSSQEILGVQFPQDYIDFLHEHGSAIISGYDLNGLVNLATDRINIWRDVVDVTQSLRANDKWFRDHGYLIPISNNGMDHTFYLDTRKSPETAIIALGPGTDKCVATSLSDFIRGLANDTLDY